MLLNGYSNLLATVFTETMIGSGSWFTQSLRYKSLIPTAFGQVGESQQRAKINWLLNLNDDSQEMLLHLIDNLGFEAGLRGSKFLCASLTSDNLLFELLRKGGYCTYGWERFWEIKQNLDFENISSHNEFHWTEASSIDTHNLLKFQHKYLSSAVRAVIPLADELLPQFILKKMTLSLLTL